MGLCSILLIVPDRIANVAWLGTFSGRVVSCSSRLNPPMSVGPPPMEAVPPEWKLLSISCTARSPTVWDAMTPMFVPNG